MTPKTNHFLILFRNKTREFKGLDIHENNLLLLREHSQAKFRFVPSLSSDQCHYRLYDRFRNTPVRYTQRIQSKITAFSLNGLSCKHCFSLATIFDDISHNVHVFRKLIVINERVFHLFIFQFITSFIYLYTIYI